MVGQVHRIADVDLIKQAHALEVMNDRLTTQLAEAHKKIGRMELQREQESKKASTTRGDIISSLSDVVQSWRDQAAQIDSTSVERVCTRATLLECASELEEACEDV